MSLYFTGYDRPPVSRSNLRIPANSPGFNFGYNDFTIEWWQLLQKPYPVVTNNDNPYPRVFMSGYRDGYTNLGVSFENEKLVYWENNIFYQVNLPVNVQNSWHHFSITREYRPSKTYLITRIFMDGNQISEIQTKQNIRFNGINSYDLIIGNQSENILSNYAFGGYLTSFLILNGLCLRKNNFTPPLQPYYPDKYTVLLLLGTETRQYQVADFYGSASSYVDSPYYSISNVEHRNSLPPNFNPALPIMPDINIAIARIKKSGLFSGQDYSAVLRQRNYDTTKVEVPTSWGASYYIKNEQERNSRNSALRRVRAGGANVPKKVTKILNAQQMFSN
jgi:hypothetical protein